MGSYSLTMVDIYPKVNSLLRVGMNPFLVFVAYFFLEDSAADFFIQYSHALFYSFYESISFIGFLC